MFTLHLAGRSQEYYDSPVLRRYEDGREAQKPRRASGDVAMITPNLFIMPLRSGCVPPLLYLTIVPTTPFAITNGKGKSS